MVKIYEFGTNKTIELVNPEMIMSQIDGEKQFDSRPNTLIDANVINKMREFFCANDSIKSIKDFPLDIIENLSGKEIFLYYDENNNDYLLIVFSGKDERIVEQDDVLFEKNRLNQREVTDNEQV